ncbi:MAG: cell division protein FtsX [Thermodesulfobacteriota bacterium]
MTILRLLLKGLDNFRANKFESALTLLGVVLITFIGTFLILVAHNVQSRIVSDKAEMQFEIYWEKDSDLESVRQDWARLDRMKAVQEITTYEPGAGLQVLADSLGQDLDLSWFEGENNPLPPTAVITVNLDRNRPQEQAGELKTEILSLQGVDRVHYNPLQLDSAGSWLKFSRSVLWPLNFILLLLVGLIVGNTVKLAQLQVQDEIAVLRLVGAARWYIALPLLSGGAFYALSGGLLALGLLKVAQAGLNEVLNTAPFWFGVEYLTWQQATSVLGVLTAVTVIFSWVNIKQ